MNMLISLFLVTWVLLIVLHWLTRRAITVAIKDVAQDLADSGAVEGVEVRQAVKSGAAQANERLDNLTETTGETNKVVHTVHHLVNNAHRLALLANVQMARQLVEVRGLPEDEESLKEAEATLREHDIKQANADAEAKVGRGVDPEPPPS